jgi:A/G-specific adenine glycosylase
MPWRETRDPYAIWVSEIMLQQTRVETAIPYFQSWMERFPTVEALADAAEDEVLKRWEGLGYYSRARNLHRAARVVRERHSGNVPDDLEGLRSLPGVGPYTAGAVGSIAFGLRTPAVDGNVRRVVARLMDIPDPTTRELERTVGAWVPADAPGDFNQALMELGATVCLPRTPTCQVCPVTALCRARKAGTQDERPTPRRRATVRREVRNVTVAWRLEAGEPGVRLALRRRPDAGLLAGMWEFPSQIAPAIGVTEVTEASEATESTAPAQSTAARGGVADVGSRPPGSGVGERARRLPEVRHAFSHLHVTYRPVLVQRPGGAALPAGAEWFTPTQIRALPLPVAQQSIVKSALEALEAALD